MVWDTDLLRLANRRKRFDPQAGAGLYCEARIEKPPGRNTRIRE
jgi:hypothetical protein